ncbi:CD2-associated protein isoform 2-T2 [Discoglossus pictus]
MPLELVSRLLEIKKDAEPKEEHIPAKREKSGNVASLVQRMSIYGIPGIGPPSQTKSSIKKKSKRRQCKVLFEYAPQNEDELELKVGDVLDIIEEVEEGWWSGARGGKSGLFPSNFVKEMELSDDGESLDISEESEPAATTLGSPASPILSPGIKSEPSPSPLSVAQPKKIIGIGFGDIFKEGSVRLRTRVPSAEAEEKKLEKPSPTQPSGTKLTPTPSLESPRTETDSKPKAKEFCRALYTYDAVNDDELSFKEGDTIHLLSKDTGEVGWWKGELNGKEGVFPDNFAAIIQDSEKEKPKKPPPPSKVPAPKPELRIGEKKFTPTKPEDKDEKPSVDLKPSKPLAPQVPPKKPILPYKANSILRPATVPLKRPEKPALPTPIPKPSSNGDSPLSRPKSDLDPIGKTKNDLEQILSRPKSVDAETITVKASRDSELLTFDDVLPTSENLSHPTASRPKMPGKRLPGRFNGCNVQNKDTTDSVKVHKEEEESAKPKLPEVKKPPASISTPPVFTSPSTASLPRQISTPASPLIVDIKPKLEPVDIKAKLDFVDVKAKVEPEDVKKNEVDELRAQIRELLTIVDTLQKEHRKELDKIKKDLEEEKILRCNLESEIDKLKRAVQLT